MQYKDYYQIMGLNKDATQDEIKRAYLVNARKYHPDINKAVDAEDKFKALGEAYEVLKDPEKRAAYDQLGQNWQAGQDFNPPPNWDAGYEFSGRGFSAQGSSPFSDFFESLFGNASGFQGRTSRHERSGDRGYQVSKGQDHHAKVMIELEDAFNGAAKIFYLQTPQLDFKGHFTTRQHKVKVKIPKGIKQGQKIRLVGQGGEGYGGGGHGDLYLEIKFKPHPLYQIDGGDIYLQLPIAPWEAALGAKIKVPTPSGNIDLTIPEGSVCGQKLRLKGRGFPTQPPGDLYAVLQIQLPQSNTEKAREIYRNMEQELNFNPRAKLGV